MMAISVIHEMSSLQSCLITSILTLHHHPHNVLHHPTLPRDPPAGVGPGVVPVQAREDQLVPSQGGGPVRQGLALPPPGEGGQGLPLRQADQTQLGVLPHRELAGGRLAQDGDRGRN